MVVFVDGVRCFYPATTILCCFVLFSVCECVCVCVRACLLLMFCSQHTNVLYKYCVLTFSLFCPVFFLVILSQCSS